MSVFAKQLLAGLGIRPQVIHIANAVLTSVDFGKLILMDSAGLLTCTLMSIDANDIGKGLTIVRRLVGELQVWAPDSDTVGPSSTGGYLRSIETRTKPCISLEVVSATHWAFSNFGCYGIWRAY